MDELEGQIEKQNRKIEYILLIALAGLVFSVLLVYSMQEAVGTIATLLNESNGLPPPNLGPFDGR